MATEHVFTKGAIYTDNDFAVRVLSRKGDFVKFMNLGNDQTFRRKISVTYVRGESYEVVDIRKNWDKGFPIAFHVTARGILPDFSEQVISRAKEWYKMLYADDDSQPEENATAEITPVSTDELYPESVADKNVLSFFNTILASNIDTEKYVRVFASMCLYEKITSTSEPHKFSNLPEAEIRVMLGFEANYMRLGSERGMYGLFTNDLNTVNVEDTAKAAKYFEELVRRVFQADYERITGHASAEGTKEEEAMTVAETIKTAGTVDAIAETLMKCGKVNDMAIAFRTVTGRDFTGRIVGVKKDNLSYDMAREIKMQFERESFAALTVSEKINFLCERDAYDTGRFLRVCRVEELREIARSIGADTAGVRTDYEMAEKLDYMSAISEKLLFRIGYAQHQPAEEKGTTQVAEIIPANDNDNALASQPAPVANAECETTAQPEAATAEIAQPEALYMDDSYSDAPGDNSCPDMDIPECREPETIPTDNNPLHHLKPCPNCRSTHIPFLKRCDDNNFSTATRRFNGGIARQHIYYRLKCRDCGHEVTATVYRTGLGRVIPHQNEADVKNEVFQAWNKQYDDNPSITIVPSDEIEKPDYTVYPDTITDECPYVTVSACDKHEITPRRNPITEAKFKWVNQFLLAVFFLCKFIIPVMAMRKNDIRRDKATPFVFSVGYKYPAYFHDKRQLLTVNERHTDKLGFSWLSVSDEDNISYNVRVKLRDDGYTELLDFKELERTCYAFEGLKPVKESNRVKYVKFEIGKSYTAVDNSYGHRERYITVIDRLAAVRVGAKDKTVFLKIRMSGSELPNEYVEGWISVWVDRQIHAEHYASTPYLHFRANQPDSVQTVPAEIYDITPEAKAQPKIRKHNPAPASDIQHKLFETKDLHFAERRAALDHNAAVISSCMFPEAVISLLSSISLQAILQLGFHMRLFIAKPKGKKNVIAELFAKRLIEYRELRANVRSKPANINAKNYASVPDGVKFFVGARRQICFKFED